MPTTLDMRPLLATDDIELLDDILRLAAAAGVEPAVATTSAGLRSRWSRHALVVVGTDIAQQLTDGFVPRRDGVVLATKTVSDGQEPWRLAAELGADQVAVLPQAESWVVDRFASIGLADRKVAPVVGFIGACGGAGSSSLTVAVGVEGHRNGMAVTAIDLDPLGAGLELLLGHDRPSGLTWNELAKTRGRLRPDAVHSSLPVAAGVHVLGWGGAPSEGVVQGPAGAAIDALTRGCDLVVVDLPRQLGEVAAAAICRCDFIVLVTPRTSVAVAAASRLLGASELDGPCIELVTRGPSPGGLSAPDVGELLGLTLVADSAADPGVVRRLERGLPPVGSRGGSRHASGAVLRRTERGTRGIDPVS